MEMESGSTPRSVLLSKGSKMSSRMLVGCKTYPHWPLDMNKAWFICMGLSGMHRQEMEGGDPMLVSPATSPGGLVPFTSPLKGTQPIPWQHLVHQSLTAAWAHAGAEG